MIQDLLYSSVRFEKIHVYLPFLIIETPKNFLNIFRVKKYLKKSGLKKYVGRLWKWHDPEYSKKYHFYFLLKPEFIPLFDIKEENEDYRTFKKEENEL